MFGRRLGGERGERVLNLAAQALRGVALGVIVTALVQSIIAGAGLWIAGVPQAGVLLALIFVLCIAQIGPLPVLVPAIVWLFWTGELGWGIFLTVVGVNVAVADNVLKPLLIRRGVDLPLLLIIPGVIGGLIGFGIFGLFVGPVLLAVTFTLLQAWVREGPGVGATSTASDLYVSAQRSSAHPGPPAGSLPSAAKFDPPPHDS
jgi:predicted PurR-regulated permease PerM